MRDEANNASRLLATLNVCHGDAQKENATDCSTPESVPKWLALDSDAPRDPRSKSSGVYLGGVAAGNIHAESPRVSGKCDTNR